MTRVDFYLLPDGGDRQRDLFCCRLTEKAYGLGHRIFINAMSEAHGARLDELLWTFRDRAFIPHGRGPGNEDVPVCIGRGEEPDDGFDLLINCADEVPGFFSRFDRVAEIVGSDETVKRQARERFRFYRDRGYPLETHKL